MKFYQKRNEKGFTLVELLVVIAIIGILAGLIYASLARTKQKGQDASRKSNLRQIALAMEMAYDHNQAYPTSENIPASISVNGNTYLNDMPEDPQGNNYTWINNTGDDQLYCVGSDLALENFFICDQNGCRENNIDCS
ncbi:MAG: prepilin-type N-terminal cleavage/methylation domain-containing protein [Parcubacteria group bacterium]|nr:prepilin-type N-terminal cleavage/methylation domain-containing protein [Parcubacteria group bacterium]